ncbi:MAG: DNA-binding protein [Halarcobacter sp.]
MERLVTTTQAAQILGLSLQGVHYRIKNNQLKSIKKSGKTYVYISEHVEDKTQSNKNVEVTPVEVDTFKDVIKGKDEQIELLKSSIKWMKKQYISEIKRLEKNQKRIIGVFNREIDLLQSAFNEMRSIYKPQIEQKNQKTEDSFKEKPEDKYLSIHDLTVYLKSKNKTEKDIKLIILKAIQKRDPRFIYNKKEKKLLILNEDFSDLI